MVYEDPRTGQTLGGALCAWRSASDLTLGAVAQATGSTITHLMDVENNKIGPTADLLAKLAAVYSDDYLGAQGEAGWSAVLGWLHVFDGLESPTNRERLEVVATSIRRMRRLPEDSLVIMRDQEVDIVFSALDLDDENALADDLVASFGFERGGAEAFVKRALNRQARRHVPRQPIIARIGTRTVGDSGRHAA